MPGVDAQCRSGDCIEDKVLFGEEDADRKQGPYNPKEYAQGAPGLVVLQVEHGQQGVGDVQAGPGVVRGIGAMHPGKGGA